MNGIPATRNSLVDLLQRPLILTLASPAQRALQREVSHADRSR